MARLTEFADLTRLGIELVYFPPYRSKYNPIERCWGLLEQHWNGAILNCIDAALHWTGAMTWHGLSPFVHYLPTIYQRGFTLTCQA